jgi:hypothetical protein
MIWQQAFASAKTLGVCVCGAGLNSRRSTVRRHSGQFRLLRLGELLRISSGRSRGDLGQRCVELNGDHDQPRSSTSESSCPLASTPSPSWSSARSRSSSSSSSSGIVGVSGWVGRTLSSGERTYQSWSNTLEHGGKVVSLVPSFDVLHAQHQPRSPALGRTHRPQAVVRLTAWAAWALFSAGKAAAHMAAEGCWFPAEAWRGNARGSQVQLGGIGCGPVRIGSSVV